METAPALPRETNPVTGATGMTPYGDACSALHSQEVLDKALTRWKIISRGMVLGRFPVSELHRK